MLGDAASVCRVYGGLGGRTGSADAERRVFESLKASCEQEKLDQHYKIIAGENADSTNAKTILEGWGNTPIETIALVSGTTHINAIVANALASALDAPILSTKPDFIPDSVQRILYDSKPSTILTFDSGLDAREAFGQLSKLPWNPEIITFESEDPFELSLNVFEYGATRGFWKDEAALVDFGDNPESLVAAPYLYAEKCPILVTFENGKRSFNSAVIDRFTCNGIAYVTIFGSTSCPGIEAQPCKLSFTRINGQRTHEACLAISEFVFDNTKRTSKDDPKTLLVAPLSITQWPELLACGALAAKDNTALILEDQTNLDGISTCLEFIRSRRSCIHGLTSIGGQTGLTKLDLELLSYELTSN